MAEYSTQTGSTPQVRYLTTDHLGSTRLVTDQLGAVKDRKDYGAFGDETVTAARVGALGYTTDEPTRKGYTGYEKTRKARWSSHRPATTARRTADTPPSIH